MKILKVKGCLIVGLLLTLSFAHVAPVTANEVTIVGEVNDEFQIVEEGGVVYEVANNEIGDYLMRNHISAKVKVTGTVSDNGEVKIITISSFEVLAE